MFKQDGVWRQISTVLLEGLSDSDFPFQTIREEVDYVLETDNRVVGGVSS